ncbi:basic salivary proline-rich protein 3-like [Portunus trituberculatus]|uniref:basic salivary proline-rich protein 3-like n=1 Tax=Portunus trituberculatus TaxID=210409 RepID=UPI001E1D1972|nr:basic salivary proline-rich protein 3-like [Portunus trituberculatus]
MGRRSFKSHPATRPGPRGPNESLTLPGPPKDIKFKDFGESSGPFLKSGPLKLPPPQGPARPLPAPEGHLPVLLKQGRFEGLPPQDPFRPPSRPRGKRPQGSRGPPPGAKPAHHARAPGRNPRIQFSASPEAVVKSPAGGIRNTRDSPHHLHSPGDFHAPQFTQPAPPRPQGKRNPLGNPHGNAVPGIRIPEFSPPHGATGEGHNFSPFPQGRDTPRRPPRRGPTFSHTPKPEPQPFPSHLQKGLDASEASQPLPGELRVKMSESHARLLRNMEYGVHGEPLDVWIPIAN